MTGSAKQSISRQAEEWIASSLALLAMTTKHTSAFPRRVSPGLCKSFRPETRERGMPDARCTRGLVCKIVQRNAHEHTGSAEAIRHSLRNGFTAYSVLSPVNGLSCHRCAANKSTTRDASVAASEPHAFAVRFCAVRQGHISVHRISTHVRDDRERPSCRVRRAKQ